jgi:hypothetical protein
MITCEMFKGQAPGVRRLINAGRRPFGRLAVLSAYCGRGWFEKKEGAHQPGAAALDLCNGLPIPTKGLVKKPHCKPLKNQLNYTLFGRFLAQRMLFRPGSGDFL